ncbi:MAG: glycosyltransferase [Saprospiraceae bacterium]|nr:glycosyltransferase [Saprospiraceae bacterium]
MITIIVLCWNHLEDVTKPFIESFLKNTKGNYELILFDNGSTDETYNYLKALAKEYKQIKFCGATSNLGFGGGNNEAWKHRDPKSTHTLFLNNDVLFSDPKWFEKLESAIEPKTVIGQHLVDFNSATEFRLRNQPYINGWCLLIDNKFLEKYGVFDPDFHIAYFEDSELCARAIARGYKLKKVEFGINHLGSKSSDQINIPEKFKYNKFVYRNKLYEIEKGKNLRIVFMCTLQYPFTDKDYEGKGVGGAEASLILLSRELAKLGHVVDIYNDTKVEGKFNGVNYLNISNFSYHDYSDVFILYRNSMPGLRLVNAHTKIFWTCDQYTTSDWNEEIIPFVDLTITISTYHRNYLLGRYDFNPRKIISLDLGINASDYNNLPQKKANKLIYCSVPRRGLDRLAKFYPNIREKVPDAELVITSDYRLWGSDRGNMEFQTAFANMPGVRFLGKIPRKELIKEQLESVIMAYPCTYDENFCISAMECMASGAVPVTSKMGALPTTVADSGIMIDGDPNSDSFGEKFANKIISLLRDEQERIRLQNKGRKRALEKYSWEYLAKNQWVKAMKKLMKDTKYRKNYCVICNEQLPNSFEFFKHRSDKHREVATRVVSDNIADSGVDLKVKIRVSRRIELSVGKFKAQTRGEDDIYVPQKQASDIVRILIEAYGEDIIKDIKTIMAVDN